MDDNNVTFIKSCYLTGFSKSDTVEPLSQNTAETLSQTRLSFSCFEHLFHYTLHI